MAFSALHIGASALFAAQRASEIAAHNVANAGTTGFTKQRLAVATAHPSPGTVGIRGDGMRGNGVTIVSIDRMRDLLADLSYRNDAATSGAAAARADVLARAEGVLGAYPNGAPRALDDFYASWDQLNVAPDSPAARANVLDAGRQVASALASASGRLDQLTEDMGERIRTTVEEVNGLASQVAGLNQAIADAVTGGQSPNDLLDQRDSALDRLATLTGSRVQKGSVSQVDVYVGNSLLVNGVTTRPLVPLKSGETWGVAFGDGPAVVGGELGSYARTISVELPEFGRQIDAVAARLAEQVNAVHRTMHSLHSTGTPDGGDFFVGTTAATLQVRPDLTESGIAVSVSGARSDGNGALEISSLRDGSPSLGDLLRGVNSRLGAAAANSDREATSTAAALSGAELRRNSANGVNIDEEMVDLVKFQHAYSAAARVISMADDFYDLIINRMGAGR